MKNFYSKIFCDWSSGVHVQVPNPNYIPGCERTRLIQRLNSPVEASSIPDSFSFGEGFTDEAFALINKLCSFDYMGASEFEFGAVPAAFKKMSKNSDNLIAYTIGVIGSPYFPFRCDFGEEIDHIDFEKQQEMESQFILEGTIFVIAPKHIVPHVNDCIISLAIDELDSVKENSELARSLFTNPKWAKDFYLDDLPVGWLELDNGFMFFKEREMWDNFCKFFVPRENIEIDFRIFNPVDFSEVEKEIASLR